MVSDQLTTSNVKKRILPLIVFSQFCCTSLWFAGNGIMVDLITDFNLSQSSLGHLTSAVQLGFILGTLTFAILTVSDRFSPSKVFFASAVLGALFNLSMLFDFNNFISLMSFRMLTGFFLAGIYPVGMKISADYYDKGLGKALGFLVGALVLGTAFPHILRGYLYTFSWHYVIIVTSILAITGGLVMIFLVPDGPYRKQSMTLDVSAFSKVFKNSSFRAAAFGYFGHMWELYAFWAFVPVMLKYYTVLHPESQLNIPILSFFIIAIGGLSCVVGGYISQYIGAKKTAYTALLLSCLCCLVSPLMFEVNSKSVFISFLLFWGIVVIADSPMFSTLVAQNADAKIKGTALTIVNCIGFTITIISIQILNTIYNLANTNYMYLLLAIGPILGLVALSKKKS